MSTVIDPILPREGVRSPQHQPLMLLLIAASLGIVLDRYWPQSFDRWCFVTLAAAGCWLLAAMLRWRIVAIAPLLLAWCCGFAAWHHAWWQVYPVDELGRSASLDIVPVCLEARALSNVRWQPAPQRDPLATIPQGDHCRLEVQASRVRHRAHWQPISGRAELVIDGHLLGVQAGDFVRLTVLMQRVPPAQNPDEFDAAAHERVSRHLVRLSAPSPDCVEVLQPGSRWNWRRMLEGTRYSLSEVLRKSIAPERAGLASGLLIGAREQIDYEQTQQFFLTGTVHILAISGVHVGILAYGFWLVMRTGLLSRRGAIVAAIVFVLLYTLVTDAQPPVVRSAILVVVICWGRWLGRPTPPLNALAAGGLVVLALNPTQFFQIGTQLSFLAVATLIYCGPLLVVKRPTDPLDRFLAAHEPMQRRWTKMAFGYVWRLWLTGTCVWLVALPLTLYRFHVMSPSALWVNPLVWIPITIALYAGFATLAIGWLVPPLGQVCGAVCDFNLWLVERCIYYGERSPGSYQYMPGPALWWVIGFYIGLAAYVWLPAWRPRWYWGLTILIAWIAVGQLAAVRSPLWSLQNREPELATTFIAVGHGTSVLLEMPDGRVVLYDAGHMGTPSGAARSISAVLWSRGITHLDAVVLSHADADHYNALPELLKRFSIKVIYVSPMMFAQQPEGVKALHEAIDKSGVPLVVIERGQRLKLGPELASEILHPPRKGFFGSDNASSIVLSLDLQGRRVLLPGDLETPGLEDVLAEEPLPSEIVMAPHHGSVRSNPRGFAQWSTPAWVVISGSRSRDATEVIDAYRSHGAEVLHTGHDGAARLTVSASGTRVQTWEVDRWIERQHRGGR